MGSEITAAQVQKNLSELVGIVKGLAKEFYSEEEETEEKDPMAPNKDAAMYKNDEYDDGEGMMPYDDESEDMYMARMRKGFRAKKGFADAAEEASSEEDSKWDEKDSKIDGNEAQPAGDQTGNEDDETFGPGGMAYSAMLKQIADIGKVVNGIAQKAGAEQIVLAKGIVPGQGAVDPRGGPGQGGGVTVTREMQEQAKGRSYRDLNRLREEVGDLPRNIF